jgi:hypothetical protein
MESSSLPRLQVSAPCPYPEPDQSNQCPSYHFLRILLNIIFPFMSGSSEWSFPLGFPYRTLYEPLLCPIHATCPAHLILLNFITRIIFGEEYGYSLCCCFPCPVTSFLFGPKFLLKTLFSNTHSLH